MRWQEASNALPPRKWKCGHCGVAVGSNLGYEAYDDDGSFVAGRLYVCPSCEQPTYVGGFSQVPPSLSLPDVEGLPPSVEAAYGEIARALSAEAYTACVLMCRKLLMHVGVDQGAGENRSFRYYVDYLFEKGIIPSNAKEWVDRIRERGNEATHELTVFTGGEAEEMAEFTVMLLRIVYEFPYKVRKN